MRTIYDQLKEEKDEKQRKKKVEEAKVEETKVEEPLVEETKVEEPLVEETKVEEPSEASAKKDVIDFLEKINKKTIEADKAAKAADVSNKETLEALKKLQIENNDLKKEINSLKNDFSSLKKEIEKLKIVYPIPEKRSTGALWTVIVENKPYQSSEKDKVEALANTLEPEKAHEAKLMIWWLHKDGTAERLVSSNEVDEAIKSN